MSAWKSERKEVVVTIRLRTDADGDTEAIEEYLHVLFAVIDYSVFDNPANAFSYEFEAVEP